MYILSSGNDTYFVYHFYTSCRLTKLYLKQVTNVLSVDILANFQRPFMKSVTLQPDEIELLPKALWICWMV